MATLPEPKEMSEEMRQDTTISVNNMTSLKSILDTYGFCVITGVLSDSETNTGISLIWDYLESLGTGVSRTDTSTHTNDHWPPTFTTGILDNPIMCAGQSRVAWWGRTKAKRVFSHLYNTSDLVTSFDTIGVYREAIPTGKNLWYHVDSTIYNHPYDYSTQGVLNLVDTLHDGRGGLVVLPCSHLLLYEHITTKKNWAPLWEDEAFWEKYNLALPEVPEIEPIRVGAPAGSLILFHSSVVHCNMPRLHKTPTPSHLGRAVIYVCMAPRGRVTLEEWDRKRKEAVEEGATTSHWPDQIEKKRTPRYPLKRKVCDNMLEKDSVMKYSDLTPEMLDLL
jgi:hypothetical protein